MNNDTDTDRNVIDDDMRQQKGGAPTTQRSKTERGEVGGDNQEIDDDAMTDESLRSDSGAGE